MKNQWRKGREKGGKGRNEDGMGGKRRKGKGKKRGKGSSTNPSITWGFLDAGWTPLRQTISHVRVAGIMGQP